MIGEKHDMLEECCKSPRQTSIYNVSDLRVVMILSTYRKKMRPSRVGPMLLKSDIFSGFVLCPFTVLPEPVAPTVMQFLATACAPIAAPV